MAHYALLDQNNMVVTVFVGRDEDDLPEGITNWEDYYTIPGHTCRRTSYNTIAGQHLLGGTPFRMNYAGIGYTYDPDRDAFIAPKPHDDAVFDESTCTWIWEPYRVD